jgi:hypothetical protein
MYSSYKFAKVYQIAPRMPILVTMLNQEMDESKVIYNKQIQRSDSTIFFSKF